MKKVIVLVLVLALTLTAFAGCGNNQELNSKVYPQDPFTSASKPVAKYDLGVTLDEMTTIGYTGTFLLATTNPDGTANVGYIIFAVKKVGDKFYISQTSTNNQSGANLFREKSGIAVWAANYDSKGSIIDETTKKTKQFSTRGIKMTLKLSEDKAVATELALKEGSYAYEIVSTVPLG